jgi:ABC-type branched-subunit amino acid transport system substrate-binding protein
MVAELNEAGGIHGRRAELVNADPGQHRETAAAALRWLVDSGDVFCIVAPFVPQLDEEIGEWAESARIPLIGPLFRIQAGGETKRFRFDALSGLREELFALASFAQQLHSPASRIAIVHATPSAGLVGALVARLEAQGWTSVRLFRHEADAFEADATAAALAMDSTDVVFFIGRENDFHALAHRLGARSRSPYLLAAASQISARVLELPLALSGRVFLAYPTLPRDWTPEGLARLQSLRRRAGIDERHAAFQVSAYAAATIAFEGLKRAGRDASREKLVRALESLRDFTTGLTPPIGYGPGRRVGAAGAHIVTVDLQRRAFVTAAPWMRVDRAGAPDGVR